MGLTVRWQTKPSKQKKSVQVLEPEGHTSLSVRMLGRASAGFPGSTPATPLHDLYHGTMFAELSVRSCRNCGSAKRPRSTLPRDWQANSSCLTEHGVGGSRGNGTVRSRPGTGERSSDGIKHTLSLQRRDRFGRFGRPRKTSDGNYWR